ncbi:unnamed protein product [Dibothriocephalus latus]|uniref:Secreted protein n=1 Tax=Dibothriocephalus latus TaxID=60516 RepID=A0A3P7MKB0_DIBLA|nr:unnamed protein product [Dibothriocephalus latus]
MRTITAGSLITMYLLVLVTAVIMPDLAGLDDVTDGTSPCVTIGGNGSGELYSSFFSGAGDRIPKVQQPLPCPDELSQARF